MIIRIHQIFIVLFKNAFLSTYMLDHDCCMNDAKKVQRIISVPRLIPSIAEAVARIHEVQLFTVRQNWLTELTGGYGSI